MVNKNKLNELFNKVDELLFYLDGVVISEKIKQFKDNYYRIRKELNNEK